MNTRQQNKTIRQCAIADESMLRDGAGRLAALHQHDANTLKQRLESDSANIAARVVVPWSKNRSQLVGVDGANEPSSTLQKCPSDVTKRNGGRGRTELPTPGFAQ